jgi:hypothetical protein
VLAVVFRSEVAQVWPKTASVYAAMGMRVNVVGLVIENQTASAPTTWAARRPRHRRGAQRHGRGRAPAAAARRSGRQGDAPLVSRTLDLGGTALAPGRARPFAVTFYDPPASTTGRESPS